MLVAVGLLAWAALLLGACGGDGDSNPASANVCTESQPVLTPAAAPNLFLNPGFEEGAQPWCSLDSEAWGKPFSVSQARARSGSSSALLELRSEDGGTTKVYGVVQELSPSQFPELLSGYYYVDRWEKGTPKQYLQFVVIVDGADNIPREVVEIAANNHQIRYLLAGAESQPTFIGNSRYVFLSREEPETGEWVYFERNIAEDFLELWGDVPAGFEKLRILFEVRWDDRSPSDGPSAADVYYDDLYLSPAGP